MRPWVKPQIFIVVALGTNDPGATPEDLDILRKTFRQQLGRLIEGHPRSRIYVMGILPRSVSNQNHRVDKQPILRAIANDLGCNFWETDGWIDADATGPGADTSDGLHPTRTGTIRSWLACSRCCRRIEATRPYTIATAFSPTRFPGKTRRQRRSANADSHNSPLDRTAQISSPAGRKRSTMWLRQGTPRPSEAGFQVRPPSVGFLDPTVPAHTIGGAELCCVVLRVMPGRPAVAAIEPLPRISHHPETGIDRHR